MNHLQGMQYSNRWLAISVSLLALGAFAVHFPGQATYDTLAQAYDGATRIYTSNQPPAMSLILSLVTLPGVLALQVALFALAVWRLLALTRSAIPAQYVLMLFLFLFPVLLIYMGIVWKDVVFAHGALLAVLLLPGAALDRQWRPLACSAAIMAVAVAVRQQAVTVALIAVLYLLTANGIPGLKCKPRWLMTCLWIVIFGACTAGIRFSVQASGDTSGVVSYEGPIRQLAIFDLGGILTRVPSLEFPAIEAGAMAVPEAHRPNRDRVVALLGRYSPDRQDYMLEPDLSTAMWVVPQDWLADWRAGIQQYPLAYIEHRIEAMSWILGIHGPEKCLPFAVGISAEPEQMLATLGANPGVSIRAQRLWDIGTASLFLFHPWAYLCLSVATLTYLVVNGPREHGRIITLQICGLLYAASYLVIGFACDFRYTYFTTIAALFGLAYVLGVAFRPRESGECASQAANS